MSSKISALTMVASRCSNELGFDDRYVERIAYLWWTEPYAWTQSGTTKVAGDYEWNSGFVSLCLAVNLGFV